MMLAVVFILALGTIGQASPTPPNPGDIVPTVTPTFAPNIDALDDLVSAQFDATTGAPLIGEPFTLTLNVMVPDGLELVELPQFPETWGAFQVISVGEVDERTLPNGDREYRQTIDVVLWTAEDHETPEAFIAYGFGGQDVLRVPVRPYFFSVPSVLIPGDEDLRPLRELVNLPYLSPWWMVAGVVGVAGIGWATRHWWRNRTHQNVTPAAAPFPPSDVALSALGGIRTDITSPAEVYAMTATIVREYIAARLDIPAPDLTTSETALALHSEGQLPSEQIEQIERLLSETDLAKFSGLEPNRDVAVRLVEVAQSWVQNVERTVWRPQA